MSVSHIDDDDTMSHETGYGRTSSSTIGSNKTLIDSISVNEQGVLRGSYDLSQYSDEDQRMFHATIGRMCMFGQLKPPTVRRIYPHRENPRRWFRHVCQSRISSSLSQASIHRACIKWVSAGEWNRICSRTYRYVKLQGIDQLSNDSCWPVIYRTGDMSAIQLCDWFTEHLRNNAHRYSSMSKNKVWQERGDIISEDAARWNDSVVNTRTLNTSWFYKSANVLSVPVYGAKAFYIFAYTWLLRNETHTTGCFRILDPSAGWNTHAKWVKDYKLLLSMLLRRFCWRE